MLASGYVLYRVLTYGKKEKKKKSWVKAVYGCLKFGVKMSRMVLTVNFPTT